MAKHTENVPKLLSNQIELTCTGRHITTIKEALQEHEFRAHLIEQARKKYLRIDDGQEESQQEP